MSDSFKAAREAIDECWAFIHEKGLAPILTLQERYEANTGNLSKLISLLETRGVSIAFDVHQEAADAIDQEVYEHFLTLAEDDIPEDAVEYWVADVDEDAQETIFNAQNIQFFEDLPDNAVLFWENGDLAFYQTPNGSVYVTESPSAAQATESQSDEEPVTEWESDYEVEIDTDEQTREEELAMQAAVNIFNFLIVGLETARDNLERKL